MTPHRPYWGFLLAAALAAACGGGNIDVGPTPTPTATPTPRSESGVSGLLVVQRSVTAAAGDALGAPPERADADATAFDRALSYADWSVAGVADAHGVSGPDGRFAISALPPGRYTLNVNKTINGNLVALAVPFSVGDHGADVVAEMAWGQVRSTSTYSVENSTVRDIAGPNGTRLMTRDGRVVEIGDPGRTLTDPDGDGRFQCDPTVAGVPCPSTEVIAVSVTGGPSQLVVGQEGSLSAVAKLSDGTVIDVTYLADWRSGNETIAAVDSWGTVSALAVGSTAITATVGSFTSQPWPLAVVERPPLLHIYLQNDSCIYPMDTAGPTDAAGASPPARTDILPVPSCSQVVQIGATIQFRALGEFDTGYYQDITDEVQWRLVPPEIGDVTGGLFTGRQAGTAKLSAALGAVASDTTEVRVVNEPTVVGLSLWADSWGPPIVADASGGPDGRPVPCFDCGFTITVLRGDTLHFHATAQYDTGAWQDVTDQVNWSSPDIDAHGVMTAAQAGEVVITATLGDITSNSVTVNVVEAATLQSLYVWQEGGDTVVSKGDQRFFRATGFYDVGGLSRDVTDQAAWHSSDERVGGFTTPGVFTGLAAGTAQVWAELDGQQSNQVSLEVFETSELDYCDPQHINRGVWSDDFNRVVLESDCAAYNEPGVVTLRYTVTETQPHGGVFNPCLDLYAYQGSARVRAIREEGCGDPFLAGAAPDRTNEEVLKYQLRAFWDLKDDGGAAVPPGAYTIYGRFYLYYDPVVSIDIRVDSGDGPAATRTPTPTGNPPPAVTPTATATTRPGPVCTPPTCGPGEVLVACPESDCPSGCGTACVPAPPTPRVEGACFIGSDNCTGFSRPGAQAICCNLFRFGALPQAISWCPIDRLDPATGKCLACASSPCEGLPEEPPAPTP